MKAGAFAKLLGLSGIMRALGKSPYGTKQGALSFQSFYYTGQKSQRGSINWFEKRMSKTKKWRCNNAN